MVQRPPLAPAASPRPAATPSRTPTRFGRLGAVFKYKYYSRAELEDTSRRQGSRADGVDAALELRRRKNYVAWMKDLTKELRLPHIVYSTAVIYMHRYFAIKVRSRRRGRSGLVGDALVCRPLYCRPACAAHGIHMHRYFARSVAAAAAANFSAATPSLAASGFNSKPKVHVCTAAHGIL